MTSLTFLFIIFPLILPSIKMLFFLGFVLLVANKISTFSYEEIKKKIILGLAMIFFIGIPLFIFRSIIIHLFELDYNYSWDFIILFGLGTFFKEFFLHSVDSYIKNPIGYNEADQPYIYMMNIGNITGQTIIDPIVIGPEERNMGFHLVNGEIRNSHGTLVTKEYWGYSKTVPSGGHHGVAHIWTGGNFNYDFNDFTSHRTICVNTAKFLQHESSIRHSVRIFYDMFSPQQRQFLTRALVHYHPDVYRNVSGFPANNINHQGEVFRLAQVNNDKTLWEHLMEIGVR